MLCWGLWRRRNLGQFCWSTRILITGPTSNLDLNSEVHRYHSRTKIFCYWNSCIFVRFFAFQTNIQWKYSWTKGRIQTFTTIRRDSPRSCGRRSSGEGVKSTPCRAISFRWLVWIFTYICLACFNTQGAWLKRIVVGPDRSSENTLLE